MQLNIHANLISIFSWVMAGLQLIISLFYGLYVVMMGAFAVAAALDPETPDASGLIFIVILLAVIGILTLFGFVGAISNFITGRRLRRETPATRKQVITASIINCLSFFCGGVFAAGLGAYELWFAYSDAGKAYFDGVQPQNALPQAAANPYHANYGYSAEPVNRDWR